MVNPIRRGTIGVFLFIGISLFGMRAGAQQSSVDTMRLALVPPDSVYVEREGNVVRIGWYPPAGGRDQVTGSRDFTYWYCNGNPAISRVSVMGEYTGSVDRTLLVQRVVLGNLTVDTVGYEPSIQMLAQIVDRHDTYDKRFNLGSNYTLPGDPTHQYVPGDPIRIILVGQGTGDTLDTGISIAFGPGIIDKECGLPQFDIDLQTIEGFHIWRGLSPYPTQMEVIEELSRQNAFMGIAKDSVYFLEWPKQDSRGRRYYEYVDRDVYAGFTYYFNVSCFDRGYFMGNPLFSKADNFMCDEDLTNPADPEHPVSCESVAKRITMTVDAQGVMRNIFAVPNPYRTGSSVETTPYYHNFPDGCIKFFNVPTQSDIKIFTISGDLVWETHHESPDGGNGVVSWPAKNKHGQDVGSGVYVYRVKSPSGDMFGRIIVIR